jgi:hypothetical protein
MYLEDKPEVILESSGLAFLGMDDDAVNSNRKATFLFNDDSEEQEPRGLIAYLQANQGIYPTDYYMVDWGYPTFEQALTFLTGGSFETPEIEPINQFVRDWILNNVVMKGQLIGVQFKFVS